jgi:hypothetical protein
VEVVVLLAVGAMKLCLFVCFLCFSFGRSTSVETFMGVTVSFFFLGLRFSYVDMPKILRHVPFKVAHRQLPFQSLQLSAASELHARSMACTHRGWNCV